MHQCASRLRLQLLSPLRPLVRAPLLTARGNALIKRWQSAQPIQTEPEGQNQPVLIGGFRSKLKKWRDENKITITGPLRHADGSWFPDGDPNFVPYESRPVEREGNLRNTASIEDTRHDRAESRVPVGSIVDWTSGYGEYHLALVFRTFGDAAILAMDETGRIFVTLEKRLTFLFTDKFHTRLAQELQLHTPDPFEMGAPQPVDFSPFIPAELLRSASAVIAAASKKVQSYERDYSRTIGVALKRLVERVDAHKTYNLRALAEILCPPLQDQKVSQLEFCALARVLLRLDTWIWPLGWNFLRDPKFKLHTRKSRYDSQHVIESVRHYQHLSIASKDTADPATALRAAQQLEQCEVSRFLVFARQLVAEYRLRRPGLPNFPGPYLKEQKPPSPGWFMKNTLLCGEPFRPFQKTFVNVSLGVLQKHSGTGLVGGNEALAAVAAVLRALDMYEDQEVKTIKLFLQELGVLSPWIETLSVLSDGDESFRLKESSYPWDELHQIPQHPDDEFGKYTTELEKDRLKRIRHDWPDMDVYCIDAPETHIADDGISIERVQGDESYWVHVHTTNVAAFLHPKSPLSKIARKTAKSWKLGNQVVRSFPKDLLKEFSLRNGSPVLTVSVKFKPDRSIEDTIVRAGRIKNVIYISPDQLRSIFGVGETPISEKVDVTVGEGKAAESTNRVLEDVKRLSQRQVSDLKSLYNTFHSNWKKNLGQLWPGRSRPGIEVYPNFGDQPAGRHLASIDRPAIYTQDPSVQLSGKTRNDEGPFVFDMVREAMVLASVKMGEWCAQRQIPAIYSLKGRADTEKGQADAAVLKAVMAPFVESIGFVPDEILKNLTTFIPRLAFSTTPNRSLSTDGEAALRCTSPLRRYEDMVAQWQVGEALLIEASTGKQFSSKSLKRLPFQSSELENVIEKYSSTLQLRDVHILYSRNRWLRFALGNAFYFKQAPLPDTFLVEIDRKCRKGNAYEIGGTIRKYGLSTTLEMDPDEEEELRNSLRATQVWEAKLIAIPLTNDPCVVKLIRKVRDPIHRRHGSLEDCDLLTDFREFTPEVAAAAKRLAEAVKDAPLLPLVHPT
ncbi:MAG: hypothetical protein M1814_006942 [Vezdaea aestivalis]|nr:MAG: hypothetical protein M1814_006942 [Vezdaea aestivalis]